MILTDHARQRRAQRCPNALPPECGIRVPRNVAKRLGIHGSHNHAMATAAKRSNRKVRQSTRPTRRRGGKPTYYLTASACWVVRGGVAVTVVELDEDALASALVWAAMGVWP